MRIAVVGPVHPYKGGVAQHTAALAERLSRDGHQVEVVTWSRQYPKLLYPGQLTIEEPEFALRLPVHRDLAWNGPLTWRRAARRLWEFDLVILAHVSPFQAPAYTSILRRLRAQRTRTVLICHNVRPHEGRFFDEPLLRKLFDAAGSLVVHSELQQEVAAVLTGQPIRVAALPPHLPPSFARRRPDPGVHRRLLFFGLVREYKGLDLLLRALALGPDDVRLRIAGEFWAGADDAIALAADLGLADRVEVIEGYVPADRVPGLFADVDALVLPYRRATGSQNAWVGFEFGVPVIATRVGNLSADIVEGVTGLVVEPDDVESLTGAIRSLYVAGRAERMRAAVSPVNPEPYWRKYVEQLLAGS
jgi:glycosyltransferase involved in cell wall biosynthesis